MELSETLQWLLSYYVAIACCIFLCYVIIMFSIYSKKIADIEMKGKYILQFILFSIAMAALWLPAFIFVTIKDIRK